MPSAIPAVIGVGASLLGSKKQAKAADADRAAQQQVMDRLAQVDFDPQSLFGPMGMGFDFDTMTSSLGAFAPFQEMLGGLAESGIGQGFDIQQTAMGMGLPEMMQNFGLASGLTDQTFNAIQNFQGTQGLQDAFGGAMDFASSMFGNATAEGQDIRNMAQMFGVGGADLQNQASSLFGQGSNFINQMGTLLGEGAATRGLALDAFGRGENLLGQAGGFQGQGADLLNLGQGMLNRGDATRAAGLDFGLSGAAGAQDIASGFFDRGNFFGDQAQRSFDAIRQDTLDTLRARDQRGEDRAAAGLADQLFGTGRLGTTGGQEEITDFARGLGEADLSRQLAASQEARAIQAQQGNLAQGFGQMGTQAQSLAPAFMNAGTNLFGQGSVMDQLGLGVMGAGTDVFNAGTGLAGLAPAMQNAATNLFGQGTNLGGQAFNFGNLGQAFTGMGIDMTNAGTNMMSLMAPMLSAGTGVSQLESIPLNAFNQFGQNFGTAQELENNMLNSAFDRFGSTMGLTNDLFGSMFNLGTGLLGQGSNALTSAMGMSTMPLDFAKFAANLAATDTSTQINAAGGQADIANNFGRSGSELMGAGLANMGNNLFESGGGFGAITDAIGGLFKKNEATPGGK